MAPEQPLSEKAETQLQSGLNKKDHLLAHITKLQNGTNDPENHMTSTLFISFPGRIFCFLPWSTELGHTEAS